MINFYCPNCNCKLKRLPNKKVGFGYFWMCSNIQNGCRTFLEDDNGKPTDEYKHHCPFCGSGAKIFSGKYGLYWACLNFEECGRKFKDNDGEPILPTVSECRCVICSSKLVKLENKKGKPFWGCSGFPKCREIYSDNNGEPNIDGAIINIETKRRV